MIRMKRRVEIRVTVCPSVRTSCDLCKNWNNLMKLGKNISWYRKTVSIADGRNHDHCHAHKTPLIKNKWIAITKLHNKIQDCYLVYTITFGRGFLQIKSFFKSGRFPLTRRERYVNSALSNWVPCSVVINFRQPKRATQWVEFCLIFQGEDLSDLLAGSKVKHLFYADSYFS